MRWYRFKAKILLSIESRSGVRKGREQRGFARHSEMVQIESRRRWSPWLKMSKWEGHREGYERGDEMVSVVGRTGRYGCSVSFGDIEMEGSRKDLQETRRWFMLTVEHDEAFHVYHRNTDKEG